MKIALLLAAVLAAQAPAANYRAEIEKYRSERVAELSAPILRAATAMAFGPLPKGL